MWTYRAKTTVVSGALTAHGPVSPLGITVCIYEFVST